MKKNVYLFEINDILSNQAKLPYSTGLIWSHCRIIPTVKDNYQLAKMFWWRRDTEEVLSHIENPSVIGFSCFVWNWNNNIELAKKIKEKYPECIIVFGGWQAPMSDRSQNFFKDHPYVDIIAHGEGEIIFGNILIENLKEKPDWSKIKGCSIPYRFVTGDAASSNIKDGLKIIDQEVNLNPDPLDTFVTEPQPRIADLMEMPSPYLNGLFDELISDPECVYDLEATIETTRGCPYACTYCEIGTKYYQKIKYHTLEKIYSEIDWLSDNKVVFVYNADSNFGMLKDHLPITRYLVDKKKKTGYPEKHRCDWSKNQADKVIELAKIFYEAEMDKGITIALQSLNKDTLKATKRKNVDGGKLREFIKLYEDTNLPSYIELILGLPEETKESFISGICQVMELGQHNYIGIYPLTALPNTPFGDPKYIEQYGLEIIDTYPAFSHVDVSDDNDFEREHMVVSSNTMTLEDYKECTLFRWMSMFAHYLGATQFVSRFVNKHLGVSFEDFYVNLMEYMESSDGFLNEQLTKTKETLDGVLDARLPWGRVVPEVRENYAWDFEEATIIAIMKNKKEYYDDIRKFLAINYPMPESVVEDILKYQDSAMLDPQIAYPDKNTIEYNLQGVIYDEELLQHKKYQLTSENKNYDGDFYEYGKETLWWGRRVAAYKNKVSIGE
jgi:putative methyltransferase